MSHRPMTNTSSLKIAAAYYSPIFTHVTMEQGQDATFTCTISDIHVSIFRLFTHIHPCDSGAGKGHYIHLQHIGYSCEYINKVSTLFEHLKSQFKKNYFSSPNIIFISYRISHLASPFFSSYLKFLPFSFILLVFLIFLFLFVHLLFLLLFLFIFIFLFLTLLPHPLLSYSFFSSYLYLFSSSCSSTLHNSLHIPDSPFPLPVHLSVQNNLFLSDLLPSSFPRFCSSFSFTSYWDKFSFFYSSSLPCSTSLSSLLHP